MKHLVSTVTLSTLLATPLAAFAEAAYVKTIEDWRSTVEKYLKHDNDWLTLGGSYVMKPGVNTIGAARSDDILLSEGS